MSQILWSRMTGEDQPSPGIFTFHVTWSVSLHSTGGLPSDACPCPSAPRNCGQSCGRLFLWNCFGVSARSFNRRRGLIQARRGECRCRQQASQDQAGVRSNSRIRGSNLHRLQYRGSSLRRATCPKNAPTVITLPLPDQVSHEVAVDSSRSGQNSTACVDGGNDSTRRSHVSRCRSRI